MNDKINIAVLLGTSREGRESIKAAKWVADQFAKRGDMEVTFVDPAELNLPHDGDEERDAHFSEITAKADAFYVVTPEYNHSFPGSLKRMLDSEYDNYFHKVIGTAGVSSGQWGGVRVCEALIPVYHRLGLTIIMPELYFPNIQKLFDENGNLAADATERYATNIKKVGDELVWMAKALKAARA